MDRRWWWRIGIALVVVAFVVLIGRMSVLAFKSDAARLTQPDRGLALPAAGPVPGAQ
jgi:hypothetical protein